MNCKGTVKTGSRAGLCATFALALLSLAPSTHAAVGPQSPAAGPSDTLASEAIELVSANLVAAETHGFRPNEFGQVEALQALRSSSPEDQMQGQAALRRAIVAYARAQHGLRLTTAVGLPAAWGLPREPYDADQDLDQALRGGALSAWLDGLPPPQDGYRRLTQALAVHRAAVATGHATAADVRIIEANLERWRWLPRPAPATRIDVNIATASLVYLRAGEIQLSMRVIVGKPSTPTPIFSAAVTGVVFNPPWNVPDSIATSEIWPKARKQPNYLARERIDVVKLADGTTRLRQRPGPNSALGLFKLEMPNRFGVYLHDTPGKSLFLGDNRALSHGCVRLEKPRELAERLLDRPDAADFVAQMMSRPATTRADLSPATPVNVSYWTAIAGEDGQLAFYRDVYGWDAKLLRLLDASRSDLTGRSIAPLEFK